MPSPDTDALRQLLEGPATVYTGVGSRETPPLVCTLMRRTARWLSQRGWVLRSGAARGADSAFMLGAGRHSQIYLPWPGFERCTSRYAHPSPAAYKIAALYHPSWDRCTQGVRALLARNVHQVMGWEIDAPSAFLLCWTPDGADGSVARPTSRTTGGTGQAIRVGVGYGVPVFNLAHPPVRTLLDDVTEGAGVCHVDA